MKTLIIGLTLIMFVACAGERRGEEREPTLTSAIPVKLHFRGSDKPTCADEIVLPELNMRKKIAANETVTFDIPAQQARTLHFACGMNMMKGTVVVQ